MSSVRGPLTLIIWGFIVVVLDFRINGLDLIADALGFCLGCVGSWRLFRLSDYGGFKIAGMVSFVLIWISLFEYVPLASGARSGVSVTLTLLLSFWLLLLFSELGRWCGRQARPDLQRDATICWISWLSLTFLGWIPALVQSTSLAYVVVGLFLLLLGFSVLTLIRIRSALSKPPSNFQPQLDPRAT